MQDGSVQILLAGASAHAGLLPPGERHAHVPLCPPSRFQLHGRSRDAALRPARFQGERCSLPMQVPTKHDHCYGNAHHSVKKCLLLLEATDHSLKKCLLPLEATDQK